MALSDDDEIEDALWEVLDTGNTTWGGKWFTIQIHGSGRNAGGGVQSWWDETPDPADDTEREEPEFLYMELDPERGIVKAQLQTLREPPYTQQESAARAAARRAYAEGGEASGHIVDIYLYEATTDVKPVVESVMRAFRVDPDEYVPTTTPTQAVIAATVENTLHKWRQAPYKSGDHRRIPYEDRMRPSDEYAERLFNVDTSFHGLGGR